MDANGALNAVTAAASGRAYLRMTAVAQDVPPVNTPTRLDANGVLAAVYDASTNSLRVTGV